MNKIRTLLLAILLIGMSFKSSAIKVVVLSDPHVMAPGLLKNEGTAWTTYLDGQRKMVDYSKLLFDDMITRIKENINPELVLITVTQGQVPRHLGASTLNALNQTAA